MSKRSEAHKAVMNEALKEWRSKSMNIGQARVIFEQIFDDKYSDEEKGMAILQVLNATGDNIRKEIYRQVIAWMWGKCFRIEGIKEQEHD